MTETLKTYPWSKLARTALEARAFCPKCGASKHLSGDDNPFFWESELKHAWLITQCDSPKCHAFFEIRKRREGVSVKLSG